MGGGPRSDRKALRRAVLPGCRLVLAWTTSAALTACTPPPSAKPPPRSPAVTNGVRYCLSVVTEYDVPRCVQELTPEHQRRTELAYRLVLEEGRVTRLERVNGLGRPADEPPTRTSSEYVYRDGRVAEVVERDRTGLVRRRNIVSSDRTEVHWLDAAGRPQTEAIALRYRHAHDASGIRRKFDSNGRVISYTYMDAKGRAAASVEGVSEIRLVRDTRGAIVDESYFDERGNPAESVDGVHRILHELDARSQPRVDRYLDASGRPMARDHRVHAVQRVYDDAGNILQVSYQYIDGRPVRSKQDGAAMYRLERDEHGAEVARTYFDEAGKAVVSAHGYMKQRIRRNPIGLPVQWSCFSADDKLVPFEGQVYAIRLRTLDGEGRTLFESFFDATEQPITLPDGYQQVEVLHDGRGNPTVFKYEDEHENLVTTRRGFAMERREYDVDRLVLIRYLDAKDRPVDPTTRFLREPSLRYQHKISYDAELGEISSEEYSGVGADTEDVPPKPEPACDAEVAPPTLDAATDKMITELGHLQERAWAGQAADDENKIPPTLQRALPGMKRVSREVVRRLLASVPKRSSACGDALANTFRSIINPRLEHRTQSGDTVGGIGLSMRTASGSPSRWVASVSFGIPCGADGSVYVLEERANGPALVMAVEARASAAIRDGQELATGKLSPVDSDGKYFLLTAHAFPRCGPGVWRGFSYRVFDPGASPDRPRKIFEERSSTPLNEDEVADLETTAGGFSVRFPSWKVLDTSPARRHIRSYRRRGNRFERVPPFADRASDVPDEWVQLPWEQAQQLGVPGTEVALKSWHARIKTEVNRTDAADILVFDEGSPETEVDHPWVAYKCVRWVDSKQVPACQNLPNHIYFHMARDGEGYRLASVTSAP